MSFNDAKSTEATMKPKRFFSLFALAPLALLAGCGGTIALSFSPNWYAKTTSENLTGTYEHLVYDVSFKSSGGDYAVEYSAGSYETTLTDDPSFSMNGKTYAVYHLHTELSLTGRYFYKTEAEQAFEDSMVSDVWFLSAGASLQPLKSEKYIHSTVPAVEPTTQNLTRTFEYTYSVTYSEDRSSAEYTLDIASPEENKGKTQNSVELETDGTFLDNEEIAFALRGIDYSSSSPITFNTIDPQTNRCLGVSGSTPSAEQEAISLLINGEKVEDTITTAHIELRYDIANPGPVRTFVYAAKTSDNENRFRNVLLRFESPIIQSLGTLTYTLKEATFNDK